MMSPAGVLLAVSLWAGATAVATACERVQLLYPGEGALVAERRPAIRWEPLTGVDRYRVQLESRIPEGRVLVSLDTVVTGTTFSPPQPLTDFRAAVKLRVTSQCAAEGFEALREQAAWFYIDTSPACPSPSGLRFDAATSALEWRPEGPALRYEILLFDAAGGALRYRGESLGTRAALPRALSSGIAAVRPFCAAGYGRSAYLPLGDVPRH